MESVSGEVAAVYHRSYVIDALKLLCSVTDKQYSVQYAASNSLWPRGQIIRPRPRPRSIWPRPHISWPRRLEICSLHGLVNNLIFRLPYSQSNHQRSFLLCIGYLLKTQLSSCRVGFFLKAASL